MLLMFAELPKMKTLETNNVKFNKFYQWFLKAMTLKVNGHV